MDKQYFIVSYIASPLVNLFFNHILNRMIIYYFIQTKHALDHGVLKKLKRLLNHSRVPVMKDATWLLSNVMAGSVEQIQEAINHNLLPDLLKILSYVCLT